MEIKARLDEETLLRLLGDILPITVLLDDDRGMEGRWVTIGRAQRLELIPGEGIRLATSGELRWPFKMVPVALRLAALQLLVRPIVVGQGPATRVLFRPVIERIDVEKVPDFVDRGIVSLINRTLEARSQLLSWHVADSLCQRFALPVTLVPLETASIDVVSGDLRIEEHWIELAVSLEMDVSRVGSSASAAVGSDQQPRLSG
jgi:hypothetical protein